MHLFIQTRCGNELSAFEIIVIWHVSILWPTFLQETRAHRAQWANTQNTAVISSQFPVEPTASPVSTDHNGTEWRMLLPPSTETTTPRLNNNQILCLYWIRDEMFPNRSSTCDYLWSCVCECWVGLHSPVCDTSLTRRLLTHFSYLVFDSRLATARLFGTHETVSHKLSDVTHFHVSVEKSFEFAQEGGAMNKPKSIRSTHKIYYYLWTMR